MVIHRKLYIRTNPSTEPFERKIEAPDIISKLDSIYSQLYNFLGGFRLQNRIGSSGAISVLPATVTTWLSVSGRGLLLIDQRNKSQGIPATDAKFENILDGAHDVLVRFLDIDYADMFGLTTVGTIYFNKSFIYTWDTVNHVYEIYNLSNVQPAFFRSSLVERFRNTNATLTATMYEDCQYSLFLSTKQMLVKLAKPIFAEVLKRSLHPSVESTIVQRIGYFEIEDEHPFREYLAQLPNIADDTLVLKDGREVKSRKAKTAHTVAIISDPDELSYKQALGKMAKLEGLELWVLETGETNPVKEISEVLGKSLEFML